MDNENNASLTELEVKQIKAALARTYKERFLLATSLYRAHVTMSKAVITHRPFIKK